MPLKATTGEGSSGAQLSACFPHNVIGTVNPDLSTSLSSRLVSYNEWINSVLEVRESNWASYLSTGGFDSDFPNITCLLDNSNNICKIK